MAVLKSAFEAAWDRYFKGVSKASKFNDVLANAAITETQFYARQRLAKNLLESRAARRASRFGHNGIIKGNPVGLMITASIPTSIGFNNADAILRQKMAKVAHSLPPINFFPPAVIQSKAPLLKALRGMFHDSSSGVLDTDQIASDNILEEKLERLDRIRAFGRATKASGFSRYARAERESNERIDSERELEAEELHRRRMSNKSFEFEMLDKDEQFIQGAMRDNGWSRDQAEQVYFKNLTENTKWLRFIAKDNPKIAKNLIPIAKTIGKASGLPIVGSFASNPALAAITATIGGFASVMNSANSANEVTKKWRNYENLYGKPTAQQEWNARLAGIKDPARIAEIYGQLAVNFGGDPDMFLLSQGIALRGMDHKQKQLHAKAFGFTPDMVRLAEIYAGATPEESDIVDARIYALEREESEGWKSGSGFRKTLRSMQLKWIPFQKDLEARGWSWGKILALANPLMFGGQFVGNEIGNAVWDEVHDTAEIDDRYRAGMYDNSTTNNNGGDRSITVIQNISAEVKNEDPVGFVKEMTLLGGRGKHEAESVLQNNDSLRTN